MCFDFLFSSIEYRGCQEFIEYCITPGIGFSFGVCRSKFRSVSNDMVSAECSFFLIALTHGSSLYPQI